METETHMCVCIVAHIPLRAGPTQKGHHVALYSLWHGTPALPALHCPRRAREHVPKPWTLSPPFLLFTVPALRWMSFASFRSPKCTETQDEWGFVLVWWNTFGKSRSRASLSGFCVPPTFWPSCSKGSKYCCKVLALIVDSLNLIVVKGNIYTQTQLCKQQPFP